MRAFLVACLFFAVVKAHGVIVNNGEIEFANPPTAVENEGEWCLIPDVDGNLYKVNTMQAMMEPLPYFSPRFGVKFELFTKSNPDQAQRLDPENLEALKTSNFNPNRPTRFVTHGWRAGGYLIELFTNSFLVEGQHDINLFMVEWGAGADTINYIFARRRVESVGRYLAQFIDFLVANAELDVKTTHLIGHSLGAHVCGFAGKNLRSGSLAKIVALDPAAPLFSYTDNSTRVSVGDADHLDVIHTSGGTLGISHPIGDASFYPNGGRSQPGCGWDLAGTCAHRRSYYLLLESIKSNVGFRTYQCSSFDELTRGCCRNDLTTIHMGGEPGNMGTACGIFYVPTNNESPFILTDPI